MTRDVIRLEKEGLVVEVSPLGGSILSAHWHGVAFLKPARSPGLASQVIGAEACFPLVPFSNRIENNRFHFDGRDHVLRANTADPFVLHGDGWLRRWTVAEQEPHRIVFRYSREADTASPFAYEATETIALGNDCLTLTLAVTNRAKQTLPYGLGFHPYFPRTPATRILAGVKRFWTEREGHLPGEARPLPPDFDISTGTVLPDRWLNNAFDGWDGKAQIEWPENRLALSLEAHPAFSHVVIYAPSCGEAFFCFEPMTHRPNAHVAPTNGGLVPLGESKSLSAGIIFRIQSFNP